VFLNCGFVLFYRLVNRVSFFLCGFWRFWSKWGLRQMMEESGDFWSI
jgi:hypothetical protein